ncbi:HAMP domain-containing histidine kinase [Clostridium swellfunianum]|uniref:HAMP domain-containing sensor histidine kinase n=1 Tax=Clostridium swellfunianum TaxID=1367462 RepID=UPI00202ECBB1|nr:HAMP domain-containing histidine kinase [Clostridium swellfunianum]
MIKARKTIKKSIFLSQISVVLAVLLTTVIAFNICLSLYIRSQAKKQLVAAAAVLRKFIATDLADLNLESSLKKEDRENLKAVLKINRALKQTQFIMDINYAIIGKNKNLIYNLHSSEDSQTLKEEILPALKQESITSAEAVKNRILYFSASGKSYASMVYPLKLQNNKSIGYLFLYSDLAQSMQLKSTINIILAGILLLAAAMALTMSNALSRKISNPISQLSKFAQNIGNREYAAPEINFSDDETGELGRTMIAMSEKLSAYDNTMKTFLQNSSHELRTPLMSIQGYAEGIKYGVVENKDKAVEIIIDESKRLSSLVEDLLYLSKIDTMQENLNIEAVNAENFLRSCIERIRGIALYENRNIRLHIDNSDSVLNIDEEKFSRSILNILANSLRYAKENIDIFFSIEDSYSVIKILDDGSGLEEEDIPRIFDRFYKGKGGKYGLGLAIAKTIVEKHKGSITAENNPQGGAYFKIIL